MLPLRKLALLALALPSFAGCAPSPEAVCEHVIGLMTKEAGSAAPDVSEVQKQCLEDTERLKKHRDRKGPFEYRKAASCIMDATTLEAAAKCYDKPKDE
jgi:hypothetical protein